MSIYETSITNPRKQLEFYKDLSEQLQQENNQLKLINKEHQQINGQLRQANKLLNEQYIRLYKDYIQLKAQIEEYQKALDETMSEKIDIQNNWNKLKEYLHNQIPTDKTVLTKHIKIFEVLDKMQELEKGVGVSDVKD